MTVNNDSILNIHINDQEIDLTSFIDLNKNMFLSKNHGRCIVFNVVPSLMIKKQINQVLAINGINNIDFTIRLNYFTEIPEIFKTNYEVLVFRVFTGAQTAINLCYFDKARIINSDLNYWKSRLALDSIVYQSYSTAKVCTFYPSILHFKYKNQVYSGKCIENPGKGKYRFTADNGTQMVVSYSRSIEAYEFRKHLNLLRYVKIRSIDHSKQLNQK